MELNENNNAQKTTEQTNQTPAIDYDKIQKMIDGRNAKTENSVLKDYFTKQGLSEEEMQTAINDYKTQKENKATSQAKELTDMQTALKAAQEKNQKLLIEQSAYNLIDDLNIDNKTMPYLLKLADLSKCADKDGKISDEALKTALEKVITDVPGLKKQQTGVTGIQVGADTNNGTNSNQPIFDIGFTPIRPKK